MTTTHTVPPVFLVTGFLGSGKTVFLQALLQSTAAGTGNAVVVNDFGDAVYDDFLLRSSATAFLELPGGCLCCSALDDFKQALTDISARSPSRIFVEATGLADSASVRGDLGFMGFPVDAAFCTVDALHWRSERDRFPLFTEQIRDADYLLISKGDLAAADDIAALEAWLGSVNNRARIARMRHGRIDADVLLAMLAPVDRVAPVRNGNQMHLLEHRVAAFRVSFSTVERTALEACLAELPDGVVRIKGTVSLAGEPQEPQGITRFLLNFVNGRWTLSAAQDGASRRSTLAVVGFATGYDTVARAFAALPDIAVEQAEFRQPDQHMH